MNSGDVLANSFVEKVSACPSGIFSIYSKEFLKKRVKLLVQKMDMRLEDLILNYDSNSNIAIAFKSLLPVHVSEFFRDPLFYSDLERNCVNWLSTFPQINIWSVGCGYGEEPVSLAILLEKNNLLNRSVIYASDYSSSAISRCNDFFYDQIALNQGKKNFKKIDAQLNFCDYFVDGFCRSDLKEKILFLEHNVLDNRVFCEAQIIFCRNVLIYYNNETQFKILDFLCQSVDRNGYICLGNSEHVPHAWQKELRLKKVDMLGKVYRRY